MFTTACRSSFTRDIILKTQKLTAYDVFHASPMTYPNRKFTRNQQKNPVNFQTISFVRSSTAVEEVNFRECCQPQPSRIKTSRQYNETPTHWITKLDVVSLLELCFAYDVRIVERPHIFVNFFHTCGKNGWHYFWIWDDILDSRYLYDRLLCILIRIIWIRT